MYIYIYTKPLSNAPCEHIALIAALFFLDKYSDDDTLLE